MKACLKTVFNRCHFFIIPTMLNFFKIPMKFNKKRQPNLIRAPSVNSFISRLFPIAFFYNVVYLFFVKTCVVQLTNDTRETNLVIREFIYWQNSHTLFSWMKFYTVIHHLDSFMMLKRTLCLFFVKLGFWFII